MSLWSKIGFGKHRTRTLPHTLMNDPEWFYWAYHEGAFKGQLFAEADLVYRYAKTILPPKGKLFLYSSEKPITVSLIRANEKLEGRGSTSKHLDLEFPRKQKNYNRETDYEVFMDSVQKVLFGKVSKPYLKREVSERFFSTPKNFSHQAKAGQGRVRGRKKKK